MDQTFNPKTIFEKNYETKKEKIPTDTSRLDKSGSLIWYSASTSSLFRFPLKE